MASKLKDLQVTKVDFVDAGANPEANIMLFKRAEEAPPAGDEAPAQGGGIFHRIVSAIAKAMGATDAQVDAAVEEIAKGDATTFGEKWWSVSSAGPPTKSGIFATRCRNRYAAFSGIRTWARRISRPS